VTNCFDRLNKSFSPSLFYKLILCFEEVIVSPLHIEQFNHYSMAAPTFKASQSVVLSCGCGDVLLGAALSSVSLILK
jgi:hypothetical protein